ncbi:MAG: GAF domain-containing sensor histidine kinase [Halobacteriovoraceae bacterium]|jgi:two-component system, NtrC family, sensor kinase|nr:GAF domain-containing sensor histidine kinase [Halobacteriovoraceae bacterium]MBT5094377.1 GAF domain-containing sensor histidine kinase [Halobacteriovoraceae bacterium]
MSKLELVETVATILNIPGQIRGEEYIKTLARNCAEVLGVQAILAGSSPDKEALKVDTECVFTDGDFQTNFSYPLEGTPCNNVFDGKRVCIYPDQVDELFPDDVLLKDMGIKSYAGAPLFSDQGEMLGIFVIMDKNSFPNPNFISHVTEILAQRLAAEYNRMKTESQLEALIGQRTKELDQTVVQLKEALNFNAKLFSTLFHDITNPLNVITLLSDEDGIDSKNEREKLQAVSKASNEIVSILDYLKKSHHHELVTDLVLEPISLEDVFSYAKFIFEHRLKEKNLTITIKKEKAPSFVGHPVLFKNSIFNNLLSNAIKFTPKNGKIHIDWMLTKNNRMNICITDDGQGIPKDIVGKFNKAEKIDSTDGTEGEKGSGLGLSLARLYLEQMNGSLDIFSCQNDQRVQGTEVCIRLPLSNS